VRGDGADWRCWRRRHERRRGVTASPLQALRQWGGPSLLRQEDEMTFLSWMAQRRSKEMMEMERKENSVDVVRCCVSVCSLFFFGSNRPHNLH
jgi:hypothetical protein